MRKLLPILLLAVLFISCSSDDENNRSNGNGNNNPTIDENLIGKWKVEYSKTIKGAMLLDDGTLKIAENAVITEYDGKITSKISSYIFSDWERFIEFTNNNELNVYDIGNNGVLVNRDMRSKPYSAYKINGNIIEWMTSQGQLIIIPREYSLKNGELIIELKPTIRTSYIYVLSKYSKLTE